MNADDIERLADVVVNKLINKVEPREWFDTPQAANYLGVSVQHLEILRTKGGGPVYSKCGRLVRYRRGDLNVWLEFGRRANTAE